MTTDNMDDAWMVDDSDSVPGGGALATARPWKVLVVDDEPDIHAMTRMALRGMTFKDRPLEILSAYSGAEGYDVLAAHSDVAVVLLDVVMETDEAGLRLASRIRKELGNSLVRIVLRTGQPGHAPEEKVIVDYDINDYKEKTELTARKLFVVMTASLRTYESLLTIDLSRQGLRRILDGTANLYQYNSLVEFSSGVLHQISAILGVGADGMLCAKRSRAVSHDRYVEVMASTGQFVQTPAQDALDATTPLFQIVNKVFAMECNHFEHPYDVLYFSSQSGHQFVVVFSPPWPLVDYQKDLLGLFCDRMSAAFDNLYLYQQLRISNEATVIALADLAEFRDKCTGRHLVRIKRLTDAVVAHLRSNKQFEQEITETFSDLVGTASILHDIGKVATPDSVLLKPGKHTLQERIIMREHAGKGQEILDRAAQMIGGDSYLSFGAQIAGAHHECFDGTGYPLGLQGTAIPLAARIVAVVDVFDALVHRRLYKEPWTLDDTFTYLRQGAGTQFDPQVLAALMAIVEKDPSHWIDVQDL